ncbi:MAG: class I SAM-dependent methyltransferase [Chloroflexi bacterium]|nr:class I SAM-dependent methyltransferase [Chloroflexota bacterium]
MPKKVRADDGLGFDNVPEIYDRVRPTYPPELFDELFSYLRSGGHRRAVEIGPATGQATRPLLEHDIAVTAVEQGERLAEFLRTKLGGEFPRLEVLTSKFEDAELESGAFDLVLAATSFHWIEPETRFQRSHDLLRDGGTLAVVHTNQINSSADHGFFARVQPVYDHHQQNDPPLALPTEDELTPPEYGGLVASGLFEEIHLHRYRWDQTYTSAEYGDLMRSYSGTQAMEPPQQEAMIGDVCGLIDAEFAGAITRPLVMTLSVGRRSRGAGGPG